MTNDSLMTIEQMAEKVQLSKFTLYQHWQALGGFKVCGAIRFDWNVTRERLFQTIQEEHRGILPKHQRRVLPGKNKRNRPFYERTPDRHGLLENERR
jgi:hypothetical protein